MTHKTYYVKFQGETIFCTYAKDAREARSTFNKQLTFEKEGHL